jgi:hypothetical protein
VTPWVLRFSELDVSEFSNEFIGNALAPHSRVSMQTSVRLADLQFFSSDLGLASKSAGASLPRMTGRSGVDCPIIETLNTQRQTWIL